MAINDRMTPVGEVLKTLEKMLADPNVKAIDKDNPIESRATAAKVKELVDYAAQQMLYVQMFMQQGMRKRLVELAEMSQKYYEAK